MVVATTVLLSSRAARATSCNASLSTDDTLVEAGELGAGVLPLAIRGVAIEHGRRRAAVGWLHADGYAGFGRLCEIEGVAKPRLAELAIWLDEMLELIPGKSDLDTAIRYARWRWDALTRYLDEGRLELSNNAAENAIRPVGLGRKNWLRPPLHAHP